MAADTSFHDLKAGKEAALHHYMAEYGKSLRFFAYNIIRDKEAAEEIVSDSFLKVWNKRQDFSAPGKIKAFLYIATKNACLDFLDTPQRRVQLDGEMADELLSNDADTLTQIIHAELIAQIQLELKKLPEQQAAIFRLSVLEGYSTEEICQQLGTTAANVYVARSKAIQTLRNIFKNKDLLLYLYFVQWVGFTYLVH